MGRPPYQTICLGARYAHGGIGGCSNLFKKNRIKKFFRNFSDIFSNIIYYFLYINIKVEILIDF